MRRAKFLTWLMRWLCPRGYVIKAWKWECGYGNAILNKCPNNFKSTEGPHNALWAVKYWGNDRHD